MRAAGISYPAVFCGVSQIWRIRQKKFTLFAELFFVAEELINATVCGRNAGGGDFVFSPFLRFLVDGVQLQNMLRVITHNLNGVRAAYRKGVGEWLVRAKPDVLCWQEVRAAETDLTPEMLRPGGLCGEFVLPQRRGYSGVALFANKKPQHIARAFSGKKGEILNEEGRFLRMDFARVSVISLYMPSGSSGEMRQEIKYGVMNALYPWLVRWRKEADKTGRDFLICGDINIAHTEKDIKNWRGNRKNSGFLPAEREWLSRVFSDAGWRDVFRMLDARDDQYTWWSNRGRARENNVGWRIDYQIATPDLAARAFRTEVYTKENFSDHAPLIVDYRGEW